MQHPSEAAPGATELHRHLDVSTRIETLLELAQAAGLEPPGAPLAAFRERVLIREPLAGLEEVLDRFELFQRVLDRPEHLERVAYEAVLDCHAEGTRTVELRFSPSFVCEFSGLGWDEALDAFDRGLQRAVGERQEMRAALLCIASRDFGPDAVAETAEFYLRHRDRLAGFDLAGNETRYPCRLYEEALRPVRREKAAAPDSVHVTIHAGEAAGPENVWEALELLGAERIGHGIRALEDPELVEHLAERKICLEMCPTSNWLTRSVPTLEQHPIRRALELGLAATINTDDPGIFGVTLPTEIAVCRRAVGLSDDQVAACMRHAAAATFLT